MYITHIMIIIIDNFVLLLYSLNLCSNQTHLNQRITTFTRTARCAGAEKLMCRCAEAEKLLCVSQKHRWVTMVVGSIELYW